ncbi:amino acid/amide ABC transporter membrane protein 1, HAAT family (TC 3.A.1.4.-) [Desulfacinum infernum DSM 9756]|uniref:Amino acid/amide ABC transporter membrane protein 1, HAAT family (TC 3.A.1.4.-) n=1 Tax=Desulfacinum infernum DSM 9756 TaxID=1121391 RepID=A0A1M5FMZ1_9BACT|nr:branched-chain amino acid ABC transporter permease [Desulfacinum infernum]SHF92875.1 amino acid/amide ABC transporter membrane protein 1, HAAT family (TC 3.A.1.4.-) [Desulfacinum infernum DSM 9756]
MESAGFGAAWLQYALGGITIGAIYALVAIGYNIIYNVTEIINFAQGEFVMLGGLFAVFFYEACGLPILAAFLAAVAAVALTGLVLERYVIRNARQATVLSMIIITIAFSILLKGGAMLAWGKDPYRLPPFTGGGSILWNGVAVQPQALWVLGVSGIIVVCLTLFFRRSVYGKAMLACADNPAAARLVGIPVRTMIFLSFMLSAAIGAAAGVSITPITLMEYDRGALLGLKGFGAAVLGGLGQFFGALVAGLLLGLAESFCAGYVSSGYKDAVALVLLLLALFFKPEGLFGSKEAAGLKRF